MGGGGNQPGSAPQVHPAPLTALAAPLVVLAILSAIVTNEIKGRLVG